MPETLIAVFVVRRGEFQDGCNMNETQEDRDATRPEAMGAGEPPPSHALVPARPAGLPVPHDAVRRLPSRRWWLRIAVLLVILAGGAGGGTIIGGNVSMRRCRPASPSATAGSKQTKSISTPNIAGRIAEMLADEGDLVKAGQVVARMDTQDIAASLKKAEAQVNQARRAVDEANANVMQQNTQVLLAQQELDRASASGAERASRPRKFWISASSNWMAPTRRLMRQICG